MYGTVYAAFDKFNSCVNAVYKHKKHRGENSDGLYELLLYIVASGYGQCF